MEGYVGPYQILRLIDQGGQGGVYLGYDKRLQRRVAIKIYRLPPKRAGRREVLREARIIAGFDSPKIVPVHDVIESSAHLAMVTEYVPGCSLEDLLRVRRPSLASAMDIGIDVASALARARQRRLVHGDVKAANVLIGRDGRARLTDFGIAREARADMGEQTGGSREAMTPEQLAGGVVDEQADLFALGCLLYRMLCGRHPFLREGRLDGERLRRGDAPPLADELPSGETLPDELLELIDTLLAPQPAARPRNTRVIRQLFRGVLRTLPISAHGKLADEARPCFRPELPEDIPPQVPDDLGRDARSRMPPDPDSRLAVLLDWYSGLRLWPRRAFWGAIAVAVVAPVLIARDASPTHVRFLDVTLAFAGDTDLPPEVSRAWLLEQVRDAMIPHLGEVRVMARAGPNARDIAAWLPSARHDMEVTLYCLDGFCVLNLRRMRDGTEYLGQGIVAAPLSMEHWRVGLASATAQIFM